ncbi:CCN family member 2-like isoform X1 [Dreissena polymorpha]|uniref:CCN family member 2-like isoform X1 n=1 Tax=Dreissena polymorpha TaxID=45954 RepID=UPI002263F200|nr:CCN family member 2-like isoform X1 [Dreissena polymorpha]
MVIKWCLFVCMEVQFLSFCLGALDRGSWVCHYPCQCEKRELNCVDGVPVLLDGCGCCYMCARQNGDLCSVRDVCDVKHGLFCDMTVGASPGTGVCKANASKPCVVNGQTYADGQQFKPECSRLCTCQNGHYGCVDLCPDEFRIPSIKHCSQPKLMTVPGQCCPQWTCERQETVPEPTSGTSGGIQPRHIGDKAYPPALEMQSYTIYEPKKESHTALPKCAENVTSWSACSMSCDVGVSKRRMIDRRCEEKEETRLCYLRPCGIELPTSGGKCTPTTRNGRQHIRYADCISVNDWKLKFCTTCRARRCCYPRRERTRRIEFQCGNARREKFDFMWIKSCRCDRQCYKPAPEANKSNKHELENIYYAPKKP